MKIGIGSYTWPWAVGREGHEPEFPVDSFELLERARKLELSVVQLADKPDLHEMSPEELERLSSAAQENSIVIEAGTRGIEPSHLSDYLRIAKILGSKLVRTITSKTDDDALRCISEVLPAYEAAGICIALENHDEFSSEEFAGFIDRIGSDCVGVCLDTVNSFAALETPEKVVSCLAQYTLNLHVKDFDIVRTATGLGFSITGAPAGQGRLDIRWICDCIKKAGKDPNAVIELWTPFMATLEDTIQKENEWAVQSVEYMKSLMR